MTSQDNVEDLENSLLRAATYDKWRKVLKMYEVKKQLRTAKITATGGTVLHKAVSSRKVRVVKIMVDLVCGERINEQDNNSPLLLPYDKKLVLGAEDDEGNTPLHLAASMGNVEICKKISGVDPFIIAKRNNDGETPLFMAALHGKRKPFLWLYYRYTGIPRVSSTGMLIV
ncbi:hypothetical protein K1719_018527 [Acacia pycnantha]|nr:hypothetical protein K1719_018527 [Acacia pycnantha]